MSRPRHPDVEDVRRIGHGKGGGCWVVLSQGLNDDVFYGSSAIIVEFSRLSLSRLPSIPKLGPCLLNSSVELGRDVKLFSQRISEHLIVALCMFTFINFFFP